MTTTEAVARLEADPQECCRLVAAYAASLKAVIDDADRIDAATAERFAVLSHDGWYRLEAFTKEHNLAGMTDHERLVIDTQSMLATINAIALMATRKADVQFAEIMDEEAYEGALLTMAGVAHRIAERARESRAGHPNGAQER